MEALRHLKSFGLTPKRILHIGANTGQEFPAYLASGAQTVVYVEPISTVFATLKKKVEQAPGHHAIRAVCSDRSGETIRFNVASNGGQSSSILGLGNHGLIHPDVVYVGQEEMTTTTVDDLLAREFPGNTFDLIAIDVQGAELKVLQGAKNTLANTSAIYAEVAEEPLYEGGCTWREVEAFLAPLEFSLKSLYVGPDTWGNAFYLKNSAFPHRHKPWAIDRPSSPNIALGKPATQSSVSRWSRPDDAQGAVSGTPTGAFAFHTGLDQNPWWQVDLGSAVALDEVLIFNRLDAAGPRAYSFVLRLGSENGEFRSVHNQGGRPFGGVDGRPARIKLDGAVARYVRIELPHEGYLSLDEVEAYPLSAASQSAG